MNKVESNVVEFSRSVKQTNTFFEKEKKSYSNWKLAMIREFFQNSIDGRAENILFKLEVDENNKNICIVTFNDDGTGMSEDILINKLFSLGGTTKEAVEGSVGGFGAAKIILFFAHLDYEIRTLDNLIQGRGGDYNITKLSDEDFVKGTEIKVSITCSEFEDNFGLDYAAEQIISEMKEEYFRFINNSILNNVVVTTNLENNSYYSYKAKVYENKKTVKFGNIEVIFDLMEEGKHSSGYSNCEVLVNGVYMFSTDIFSGSPYVDKISYNITGDSTRILTTNRDGFTDTNKSVFDDVFTSFFNGFKDAESVLDLDNHLVVDYGNYKGTDKQIENERLAKKENLDDESSDDTSSVWVGGGGYYSGGAKNKAHISDKFKEGFKNATLKSISQELEKVKSKMVVVDGDKEAISENIALTNIVDWDVNEYGNSFVNAVGGLIKSRLLNKLESSCSNGRIRVNKSVVDPSDYVFKIGYDKYNHIGLDFSKKDDAESFYLVEKEDKRILYFNISHIEKMTKECFDSKIEDVIDLFIIQRLNQSSSINLFSELTKRFLK